MKKENNKAASPTNQQEEGENTGKEPGTITVQINKDIEPDESDTDWDVTEGEMKEEKEEEKKGS